MISPKVSSYVEEYVLMFSKNVKTFLLKCLSAE